MPRAALLSIHARVEGTTPTAWEEALIQVWGPRYSAYVIAAADRAVFTVGRLPDERQGPPRRRGHGDPARHIPRRTCDGRRRGRPRHRRRHPNALRYGASSGRILIRWDGARRPTVWTVPPPTIDPLDARQELVRRYIHVFGPATPEAFAEWAGVSPAIAHTTFAGLGPSLMPVRGPIGDGWILASDEPTFRAPPLPGASARFLPSGDTFFLLQGADRELLVPDADRRAMLWTPRVWPGALLVEGEVVGTWRRAQAVVTVEPWQMFTATQRDAIEAEAVSMPLPDLPGPMRLRWPV